MSHTLLQSAVQNSYTFCWKLIVESQKQCFLHTRMQKVLALPFWDTLSSGFFWRAITTDFGLIFLLGFLGQ